MSRRVYFREIYFYIICIVAIIVFIVGIMMAYDGVVNTIKPTTYMTKSNILSMYSQEQYGNMTEEQIEELAQDELDANLQNEKNMAFKTLLRGVLLIIIAIPLFAFHWRKAQQMWTLNLESSDGD